jgi:VWFA-related protein
MTAWTRTMCLLMLSGTLQGQAVPTAASGQPVTTLKVSTRMVAISAVVKSKGGAAQGGMTANDFVLKQDGKEQPIHYFSQGSDLPLTFAVMVDTSGSQRTFISDETLASDVFFETMLDAKDDRAMLVQFDAAVTQLQGMTHSANALRLASVQMGSRGAASGGTLLYDAIYAVAKGPMAKETGRKAMVVLTDGGDNGSRKTLAEAVEQAQRADVQIYSVVYSASNELNGVSGGHTAAEDAGRRVLEKLSQDTGGHVFEVSRTMSLREVFAAIGEDLRLEYELGYTPPSDTAPNSYHKLALKAKDKKLTVQARDGFFAQP